MQIDIYQELSTNFIEYAVAVNTDRAIPDAKSGLKPVAKRILYCMYKEGYINSKPHVKCANAVGQTMAQFHPHGDSSIYGALVRLSQDWVMRYPLIDFHGSNGNRDGDGPAAYRYTESRLAKITEDGMLLNMKKKNVDYIPNYSETEDEPITLPSLFPNLLCNPNTGIGVAMACNWAPHNLKEVTNAIYDYLDGKEPMLPGPDFPTGGIIINKDDIPSIMRTGHGSVKLRGKYNIEENNIVFYEIPYGVTTEALMEQIGKLCDDGIIDGILNIRNESTRKKGFRLVFECDKNANIYKIINLLFKNSDLQTSFSYNQVALIDKTPTELNLRDCCKIYVDHNIDCITRETLFDINKTKDRIHVLIGLIRANDIIDEIIAMIKQSSSAIIAKENLISKWQFTEPQAKAILDMKLSKLAKLEKEELEKEKKELELFLIKLQEIYEHPQEELRKRLQKLVQEYGDDRRTELTQISEPKDNEKEIANVEPEKCIVVLTESGYIKRMPTASFRAQRRNTKGVKTQDDITSMTIRTNTIDNLMIFSTKGKMYRLLVDDIPVGNNTTKGTAIKSLVEMEADEQPTVIYSIYRDTDAKFVVFVTKNGIIKKTTLDEYSKTKKKSGIAAITLKENDELVSVFLAKDEDVIIATKDGYCIRIDSKTITPSGRTTMGLKGITLRADDYVIGAAAVRHTTDNLALFSENGLGKRINLSELPTQLRGGKGLMCYKSSDTSGNLNNIALIEDSDNLLISGNKTNLCISASEIPLLSRNSLGNIIIKGSKILSVSKV